MIDKAQCELNEMTLREELISAQGNNIELVTGGQERSKLQHTHTNYLFTQYYK